MNEPSSTPPTVASSDNVDRAIHPLRRLIAGATLAVLAACFAGDASRNWERLIDMAVNRAANWSEFEARLKTNNSGLHMTGPHWVVRCEC